MCIGIVTPAFNVEAYLGDAIRSVLAQTHRAWTMTIVDDGSTDQTAAVAAGFDDPRIHLVRQSKAGVSAARNLGLTATNADMVLFLDADDWLSPNALSVLTATLRANPGAVAAVGPWQGVPTGKPVRRGWVSRPMSGDLLEALLVRNLFANGGHLLIRRQALDAAGPFNPHLSFGEDWEYWVRLARLGRFAAAQGREPLLFVRERHDSAYRGMAVRPEAFVPCMDAIFNAPELKSVFSAATLARMRRRAEAENHWVIGRELIRHGRMAEGRQFLRRSVAAAPGLKRLVLLAAVSVPAPRPHPFRSYPAPDTL
jgi:glycosyltransferase involved in cell wall biosynthesis